MENGSFEVGLLENDGVPVLNPLSALMATHDKLQTARLLEAAGLPHPNTTHIERTGDVGNQRDAGKLDDGVARPG